MEELRGSRDKLDLSFLIKLLAMSALLVVFPHNRLSICVPSQIPQDHRNIALLMHMLFFGIRNSLRDQLIKTVLKICNGFINKRYLELNTTTSKVLIT